PRSAHEKDRRSCETTRRPGSLAAGSDVARSRRERNSENNYIELLSEVQRPSTFVPTVPMTAIAPTTIRPAISAYSSTSPPHSSFHSDAKRFFVTFIYCSLHERFRCPN